jgi:hypothetical protein
MPIKKQRIDAEYTRLLGNHMINAKGFFDYGVKRGLTTPEAMRLTVAKRKETAKALVDSGLSRGKVAKILRVSKTQVHRDVSAGVRNGKSVPKGNEIVPKRNGKKPEPGAGWAAREVMAEVTATSALQALFDKADANGGAIYFEVNGYGIRVKKLTC